MPRTSAFSVVAIFTLVPVAVLGLLVCVPLTEPPGTTEGGTGGTGGALECPGSTQCPCEPSCSGDAECGPTWSCTRTCSAPEDCSLAVSGESCVGRSGMGGLCAVPCDPDVAGGGCVRAGMGPTAVCVQVGSEHFCGYPSPDQ